MRTRFRQQSALNGMNNSLIELDKLHPLAGLSRRIGGGSDQQRIGLGQKVQPGGILIANGRHSDIGPGPVKPRAEIMLPLAFGPEIGAEAAFPQPILGRQPLHCAQKRPDEQFRANNCRYGISWKSDHS